MILSKKRKLILGVAVLLLALIFTGCSGDSNSTEGSGIIDEINHPDFVIENDSDPTVFSVKTTANNPTYQWVVENSELAEFTDATEKESYLNPTSEGIKVGQVNIQVKVNDTVSQKIEVALLGEKHENTYGGDGSDQFHAIIATKDMNNKGYIAAGYKQVADKTAKHEYEKDAFVARADKRGVTDWTNTVDGSGDSIDNEPADDRFMAIEDITKFGFKDEYFVIGYQWTTNEQYEGYIMRVNRDGELNNEYTDLRGDNVFLRSAVLNDYLIVVGNEGSKSGANGYIAKIDPEKNEDAIKKRFSVTGKDYTRLTSVEKTNDDKYVITAFAGVDSNTTNAYFVKLDSTLDVDNPLKEIKIKHNDNSIKRLYSIEPTSDGNYVVVGSTNDGNGFMAKVDSDGNHEFTKEYKDVTAVRDVVERHDNNGYILVSNDGSVVKTDNQGAQSDVVTLADNLRSVTQSADGNNNYLVAGRKDNDAYAAKLNDNLAKVNRIQ